MRLQSRHRTYSFVAALSAIVLTNPAPANDGSDLYDTIMRAWHLRQQKVQNARFQLSCVHTFHEGSLDRFRQVATGKAPTGAPDPPHDIQAEYEESVSIRGNKMRLTSDLPRWDPDLKGLRPEHNEAAFDGSLFKSLRKTASAKQSYPLGVVKKSARSESAEQYSMLPLLLSVLSEDEPIARDLARYEVTGKSVKVSGRPCVELAATSRVQDRRDLLYLDSERDYVVVRKATIVNGVTTWQLDVQNGPDATVGWIPQSWQYVVRASPSFPVIESGRRKVKAYELNTAMDDSEFDLKFPPGTRVIDSSSGSEVQHVVQHNGEPGIEIKSSARPTYEDLDKPAPYRFLRTRTIIAASVFGVCLCGLAGVRYARKRRELRRSLTVA